jgi:prepilin peptidase CpaA
VGVVASHIALAALLLVAAMVDLKSRRIPNALSLAIGVGGAAASCLGAAAPPISAASAFAITVIVLVGAWLGGVLGAGDVKFAGAVAVWVGLSRLPSYAAATALAGGALSLVWFAMSVAMRRSQRAALGIMTEVVHAPTTIAGRRSVPYGVAIAFGAAYAVFGGTP